MKIYFSGSRFFREKLSKNYSRIFDILKKFSEHIYDSSLSKNVPLGYKMDEKEKKELYVKMEKEIDRSDVCVFEATYPSTLHIGHEITLAYEKGKPVVVCYTKSREPILFRGLTSKKIFWLEYDENEKDNELTRKLGEVMDWAGKMIDVRFNFFVSPKILNYLDWVAKTKRVPRSVYIRGLIEKEMKKDKVKG